ncbi:ABC transporter ATP-binding protein [Paenibacillus xylaniclasticus]|uniref:ABC transporter ATP-binding protein n=1 Tax=Paenibacillus xylaniclasticus TaxID=588083 RepID=UPI000FDA65A5|nr:MULTISPECIES: ATP-binding cassette domain-containing protein [Paenibacillus]GFN30061.1 putative ABC transporter (ATP-binding protein) [Paenibacillus curdlanolyticus]
MSIINVEDVSKIYKRVKREEGALNFIKQIFVREYEYLPAVENISFKINEGEMVGFLGPNGAGKSTTIKMLTGILVPSSGEITVKGNVPYKNRERNAMSIGTVFGQKTQLWWDIPVIESLNLCKYMYKIPSEAFNKNLNFFMELLEIYEFSNIPVRQLSLGQRMRADLCAALLHSPDILFLDEPTIGLDVVVKEKIRGFIQQINKEKNTTVILTTHDMMDIEKICNRVMVIDHGNLMYDGGIDQLKKDYGNNQLIKIETSEPVIDIHELLGGILTYSIEREDKVIKISYDKRVINSSQILKLIMGKYTVKDFYVKETNIEEIIRNMYTGRIVTDNTKAEGIM